ncbi:MAG: asparagine--tRNA ligase [Oscillospiraceae bacterium]|nr:asparagine--tRNA ligase [Oscillospiraceae bacterium]
MPYTAIREIFAAPQAFDGQQVELAGWVRSARDMKNFCFLDLNDGTRMGGIQAVGESNLPNFSTIANLNVGTAVTVRGTVVCTPQAKQPLELKLAELSVEGESPPEYPLQKKRHSMEFLRTIAHLRPRTNTFQATFRVRSEASFAIHDFFHKRGFVYAHTPIITGSDAEGAGQMFRVTTLPPSKDDFTQDFFGKQTHLTVSGQLQAEAFALAFGKTYTFGPTFRAENSNTPRHAAEFWMIEPEIAFADINDDMELAEAMMKHIVSHLFETCADELAFFDRFMEQGLLERLEQLRDVPFGRMTYTEAIAELEKVKDKFEFPVAWGSDIQTEHERFLSETLMKKPVFVVDYPKEIKSFYMRLNNDGKTVAAMDMLVPGVGELIGGSQREERLDVLEKRIIEDGMLPEAYEWYLELRKFGGVKHAGFGLGFERLLMYVTGMANIRDVVPFPRTAGQCEY